jgi:hypothetical protein
MTDNNRRINEPDPDHECMTVQDLDDIRSSDQNFTSYRYDCAIAEEYADGNQFNLDDVEAAEGNGIALTIANYVKPVLDDIRGIQEAALTSWKVKGENPANDDQYRALGAKLFETAKLTQADRCGIRAFGSQTNVGVGWVEIGRQESPLLGRYCCDDIPWREMFWDMRSRKADLSDATYIHRVKTYHKTRIIRQFSHIPDIENEVEAGPTPARMQWMNIEPPQQYRAQPFRRSRDFPILYQNTPKDKDLRVLEEVWRPIYLEGLFARLPNGRTMLYDERNSMLTMMVKNGIAKLEQGPYTRWRSAIWCGNFKLTDEWSTLPWMGHPYIAFYGYREGMTNVPYGKTRGLISLQDEINSAAAKFHFGIDAVRIIIEENALSDSMTIEQVMEEAANKRGVFIVKSGKMNAIKFDHHQALNEQNFKRAQDAKADIRNVSGVAGLNPQNAGAGMPDAGVMNAVLLRSLANMGELAGNYIEAKTLMGMRFLEMIREDIAEEGDVEVSFQHPTLGEKRVTLHSTVGLHPEYGKIIANDVTLLKAEIALEDVPHTVTYRGQQLSDNMKMAQSCPPEAVEARTILMANVVKLSDVPHGEEVGQHMLEQAGLVPPSTPEAAAKQQAAQQQAQQQHELTVQDAMAQISHKKAQTQKLLADSDLKQAMAQSKNAEIQNPQFEQANQQLLLERTSAQNRRTVAQAEKIEAELNAQPPIPQAPPPIPEKW